MNLELTFMSSMDPMKDDSWILSETMRKTSLRPSRLRQLQNTKSSSLMKQITHPMMYNSSYGRLLRSLLETADSSSPAITKTKSWNLSIPVAPSSSLESKEEIVKSSQHNSFKRLQEILDSEGVEYDNKVLVELVNKHFPDWRRVFSTRFNGILLVERLILASLPRSLMLL